MARNPSNVLNVTKVLEGWEIWIVTCESTVARNPSNVPSVTSASLNRVLSYIMIDHIIVICLISVDNVAKASKIALGWRNTNVGNVLLPTGRSLPVGCAVNFARTFVVFFITCTNMECENSNSSSLRPGSGMQSRNMVGQLHLLLYFFYQAELFPDDKTRRPALP